MQEARPSKAQDSGEHGQAVAAAQCIGKAILQGKLDLFALLPPRSTPTRLHDQSLIEAAFYPTNSIVMTFAYICRRQRSFGLSWEDLRQLSRDPLCLEQAGFRTWLKREKKIRRPRGRPSRLRDEAVEKIDQLVARRKLEPSTSNKEAHYLLQKVLPEISPATVRRARKQVFGVLK
jgi:hypothetical protein